jgi:hypothetical protein
VNPCTHGNEERGRPGYFGSEEEEKAAPGKRNITGMREEKAVEG